jgi:hypothetical protein
LIPINGGKTPIGAARKNAPKNTAKQHSSMNSTIRGAEYSVPVKLKISVAGGPS